MALNNSASTKTEGEMKGLEELKKIPRLIINTIGIDGGQGEIHIGKWVGSVIWSFGGGWEHVSVCPYKKHIIPSWEDMCRIKDMFWGDEERVVQFHPAKSKYINLMPNCLHLWRPIEEYMPEPPMLYV